MTFPLMVLNGKVSAMQLVRAYLAEAQDHARALETQLAELSQARMSSHADLARIVTECDNLRAQFDDARANHEATRIEIEARAAAHDQRWALQVDRARETLKQAHVELARHEKESRARVERLTHAIDESTRERQRLERLHAQDQAELTRLRDETQRTAADLAELRKTTALRDQAAVSQTERLQAQLSNALDQLAAKDHEHGALLRSLVTSTPARNQNCCGKATGFAARGQRSRMADVSRRVRRAGQVECHR
jgi:chromosome segregation ATPase